MTLVDRAASYNASEFGQRFPASQLQLVTEQGRDVIYGRWVLGNDYKNKSGYYGEFPPTFLDRLMALFPDLESRLAVLHAFSGSLPAGPYARCDAKQDAEFNCRVEDLPTRAEGHAWALVIADPPYSDADAVKYGTPMVNRGTVTKALAQVTLDGGYLAWLDTCWPMHSKRDWLTVGRICVTRCTNHRTRDLTLFQRGDRELAP